MHSHITQTVAATNSCVTLIGAHQRGIAVGLLNGENPHLTAEVSAKQSIKGQLHTTLQCGNCWLGTAQQFYHDIPGEGGS